MSFTIAKKPSPNKASHKTLHRREISPKSISPMSTYIIQPKANCVCGGGCPRCQQESYQPKLHIGQPNSKYEQEANHVANQVMRMPQPAIQCQPKIEEEDEALVQTKPQITSLVQCRVGSEEDEEMVHAKHRDGVVKTVVPTTTAYIRNLKGGGQPLPASTRHFFESRFGREFSNVRVHTGPQVDQVARSIYARAFTVGRDIMFGHRQYAPGTNRGDWLLAHELTHVIQQGEGTHRKIVQRQPDRAWQLANQASRGMPWNDLPKQVRYVFKQSFTNRKPGWWIWKWGKSASYCYNMLGQQTPAHLKAFLRVYGAMKMAGLWNQVKHIAKISGPQGKTGSTRVPEIDFVPQNVYTLIAILNSTRYCRDTTGHIAKNLVGIISGKRSRFQGIGWRQIVPAGTSGLHIYPGTMTKIHIDDKAPVAGRAKNGDCIPASGFALTHASYDLWKWRHLTLFPGVKRPLRPGEVYPILEFRHDLLGGSK